MEYNIMRELNVNEIEAVNGGNPYVIGAVVGWAVSKGLDAAVEALSEVDWGEASYEEMTVAP